MNGEAGVRGCWVARVKAGGVDMTYCRRDIYRADVANVFDTSLTAAASRFFPDDAHVVQLSSSERTLVRCARFSIRSQGFFGTLRGPTGAKPVLNGVEYGHRELLSGFNA